MTSPHDTVDTLYRRFAPVVYRRCRQLLVNEEDALDAVQDVFITVQRKLDSFRGDANIMTWVYRVATNHCLNKIRSEKTRQRAFETVAQRPRAPGGSLSEDAERRDLLARLLARFSERQVQIVVHLYFDEMTQPEVAEVLGISERAVRKALTRIREIAGAELEALGIGGERQ